MRRGARQFYIRTTTVFAFACSSCYRVKIRVMITWKCDQFSKLWRQNTQTVIKFKEAVRFLHQKRGLNKQSQLNRFSQLTRISSESISTPRKKKKKNAFLHRVASLISNKLNARPFISLLVFFSGCDLECFPIKTTNSLTSIHLSLRELMHKDNESIVAFIHDPKER